MNEQLYRIKPLEWVEKSNYGGGGEVTPWKPRAGHTTIADYRAKGEKVTCRECGAVVPKLSPMQRATCGAAECRRKHKARRKGVRHLQSLQNPHIVTA